MNVKGDQASIVGRKINSRVERAYPATFPEFRDDVDPRLLTPVGRLPANATLVNGGFEDGLTGWQKPHRYLSDESPAFAWKVDESTKVEGKRSAWLYCHEKGDAWAYDESIELYQVVRMPAPGSPVFSARYCVPASGRSHFGGGYIRLAGYSESRAEFAMIFHWGAREARVRHLPSILPYLDTGESRGPSYLEKMGQQKRMLAFPLPDYDGRWHALSVDIADLLNQAAGNDAFENLRVEKIAVAVGVWCGMEPASLAGAYFDDLRLEAGNVARSTIDGTPLKTSARTFDLVWGQWYQNGFDKK